MKNNNLKFRLQKESSLRTNENELIMIIMMLMITKDDDHEYHDNHDNDPCKDDQIPKCGR